MKFHVNRLLKCIGKGVNESEKSEKKLSKNQVKSRLYKALLGKSCHPGISIRTRIETDNRQEQGLKLECSSIEDSERRVIRAYHPSIDT